MMNQRHVLEGIYGKINIFILLLGNKYRLN